MLLKLFFMSHESQQKNTMYSNYKRQHILHYDTERPLLKLLREEGLATRCMGIQKLQKYKETKSIQRWPGSRRPTKITTAVRRLWSGRWGRTTKRPLFRGMLWCAVATPWRWKEYLDVALLWAGRSEAAPTASWYVRKQSKASAVGTATLRWQLCRRHLDWRVFGANGKSLSVLLPQVRWSTKGKAKVRNGHHQPASFYTVRSCTQYIHSTLFALYIRAKGSILIQCRHNINKHYCTLRSLYNTILVSWNSELLKRQLQKRASISLLRGILLSLST